MSLADKRRPRRTEAGAAGWAGLAAGPARLPFLAGFLVVLLAGAARAAFLLGFFFADAARAAFFLTVALRRLDVTRLTGRLLAVFRLAALATAFVPCRPALWFFRCKPGGDNLAHIIGFKPNAEC